MVKENLVDQEEQIVINEEPEVIEEQDFDVEGLMPEEVEMAQDLGLVKEKTEDGAI